MTRLVFIRHGITDWNKLGRYCGRRDIGLSVLGRAQALALKPGISRVKFDRIYCSDKKRARQTRKIIFGRRKFTQIKGLREVDFGVFEGLNHKQIIKKYPQAYEQWLKDPYQARIPKAEPLAVFRKRVSRAVDAIVRSNPQKTVAVVCHGGVIGIFLGSISKSRNFWKYIPRPASITVVTYKNNKYALNKFNSRRMPQL